MDPLLFEMLRLLSELKVLAESCFSPVDTSADWQTRTKHCHPTFMYILMLTYAGWTTQGVGVQGQCSLILTHCMVWD